MVRETSECCQESALRRCARSLKHEEERQNAKSSAHDSASARCAFFFRRSFDYHVTASTLSVPVKTWKPRLRFRAGRE